MNQVKEENSNAKKGFLNLRNILIITGILSLIVVSVIGFFGYQFYQEIQLSQKVAESVNQSSGDLNSISSRLETIATDLEALENADPSEFNIDKVASDLEQLDVEISEVNNNIQDGPVQETQELAVLLKDYLNEVSDLTVQSKVLVANSKCLLEYFENIDKFGDAVTGANENIAIISKAYMDSTEYLVSLENCYSENNIEVNGDLKGRLNALQVSTRAVSGNLDIAETSLFNESRFNTDIDNFRKDSEALLDELSKQFDARIESIESFNGKIEGKAEIINTKLEEIRVKYDLVEV